MPLPPPMLVPAPRLSAPKPGASLIPQDVIEAWQHEVGDEPMEVVKSEPNEVTVRQRGFHRSGDEVEESNTGEVGFIAAGPADPAVALLALSHTREFAGLPRPSLEALANECAQLEISDQQYLFSEGDVAESFFVVVDGALEILRRKNGRETALRHMGRGEAVGLFGLFSGQLRAAHARAIGDAIVLEISVLKLQALIERDDALHDRLVKFYEERILEGFLGSSRLFGEIDSIARARMIGKFRHREVKAGETVMHPGEVTNALAVVTHGTLLLEERLRVGQQARTFEVTQGQFVCITGAMTGMPTRLRAYAEAPATLVVLGQKELNELIRDYPALSRFPRLLPAHARQLDHNVFCGSTGVPGL